ncbi:glycosyltransferase family 4 protein [Naasia aerilata]|uniref:Glycosyl transferase family 1 n=1 Tax=Naasia aerilata TaxID=1162966 RepID=A0ABN6XLQ8_9MICO|nr:glycosyltransferase family 4 protein [Naasia aerilata]BDZ45907.1 glycosyl transferase family 1 [Naasia aerilata]
MVDCVLALNYYAPYVSGLTNVARDIAEGLAARGHNVTVVAAQHDKDLPLEEVRGGVRVLRTPVRLRIGKGVVSPSLVGTVLREARNADVLNLHLPMLEAGYIARRARKLRAAVALTYQCDVALPPGALNRVQQLAMDRSSRTAARAADAVAVSSDDYADASRIASDLSARRVVIPPGCHDRTGGAPTFRETPGLHVGFLGRLVEEKGIEYLVEGFTKLQDPDARLLIAGSFSAVAGGSVIDRVRAAIGGDERIRVLGFLPDEQLADFYASLDVFALTSVNSFEAFGIVQVEAMMAGVPALASDLPGVRRPAMETGFGVVVPRRNSEAITRALTELPGMAFDREASAQEAARLYGLPSVLDRYEALFERLATGGRGRDQAGK